MSKLFLAAREAQTSLVTQEIVVELLGGRGKSAYEVWLEQGHTGTSADYLNYLSVEAWGSTRASAITFMGSGIFVPRVGAVYSIGGLSYIGVPGSTVIPDMPGLEPHGDISLGHWGADPSGATDVCELVRKAVNFAQGRTIWLEANAVYRCEVHNALTVPANGSLVFEGRNKAATLWHYEASFGDENESLNDKLGWDHLVYYTQAKRIIFRHMTLRGSREVSRTQGCVNFVFGPNPNAASPARCDEFVVDDCIIEHFRQRALVPHGASGKVVNSLMRYGIRGGITPQDPGTFVVDGNTFLFVRDDPVNLNAISREDCDWRITNNTLIASLRLITGHGRRVVIQGNKSQFCNIGFIQHYAGDGSQMEDVLIADNICENLFAGTDNNTVPNGGTMISIRATYATAGIGPEATAGIPGSPDTAGNLISPEPTYWGTNKDDHDRAFAPAPGIIIRGNIYRKTAISGKFSDYFGSPYVGRYADIDPDITLNTFDVYGVAGIGSVRDMQIIDNVFSGCFYGVYWDLRPGVSHDMSNVLISRNQISDFKAGGLGFTEDDTLSSRQDIFIRDNLLDGDPYHRHPQRQANGAWNNSQVGSAFRLSNVRGYWLEGNTVRNVPRVIWPEPAISDATRVMKDNVVFADVAGYSTYSSSNKGVGRVPARSNGWKVVLRDSDPVSTTFREVTGDQPVEMDAMPTSGQWLRGSFVRNSNYQDDGVLGWRRLVSGNSHVAGTDWLTVPYISSAEIASLSATAAAAATAAAQAEASVEALGYLTPQAFGAKGDYSFTTQTGTDDTAALQAMISQANATNTPVFIPKGNYLLSGPLEMTSWFDMWGVGKGSVFVKADSYTGDVFRINIAPTTAGGMLGIFGQSAGWSTSAKDYSATGFLHWSNFNVVGQSRAAAGTAFNLIGVNDLMFMENIGVFNIKGPAIVNGGYKGTIRESVFSNWKIRNCGNGTDPVVWLKTDVERGTATVSGTTVTLTSGSFAYLRANPGTRRIRVMGTASGAAPEITITSFASDTVATLSAAPAIDVTNQPAVWYADFDGANNVVFSNFDVVMGDGPFMEISCDRLNSIRRVALNDMLFHGFGVMSEGTPGDLIRLRGAVGYVTSRNLRTNSPNEKDGVKKAVLRIMPGETITTDVPSGFDLDINLNNIATTGEAHIVVEGMGFGRITGMSNTSATNIPELKVLTGAITKGLVYGVIPVNGRDAFPTGILDIASDQRSKVLLIDPTAPYQGSATISGGVVTVPDMVTYLTLDTEGAAATDDLDTITVPAWIRPNQMITLRTANNGRDVTVKNGTGNIFTTSGADFTLATTTDRMSLVWNGSVFRQVAASAGSGSVLPVGTLHITTFTDAAVSVLTMAARVFIDGTLTRSPLYTLGTTSAVLGDRIRVERTDTSANTWTLQKSGGAGTLFVLSKPGEWAEVTWNGTAWEVTGRGLTVTSTLAGLVPPTGSPTGKYLRDDGTWATPAGGGLTDGDKGGIIVSGGGTVLELDYPAVNAVIAPTWPNIAGKPTTVAGYAISDALTVSAAAATYQAASEKGQPSGYASLDGSGKVPSAQLPSFVDDVLEVADFASLPGTGETGKIYVTLDTSKTWRWSGSAYVEISPSPGSTDSVTEGASNLYFTEARVRGSVLTGFAAAGSRAAIAATDTLLAALGNVQKYLNDLATVAFTGDWADLTGKPTTLAAAGITDSHMDPFIKPTTGEWVSTGGVATTIGMFANNCLIGFWRCPHDITIDQVGVNVSTAGSAGTTCKVVIYDATAADKPNTLLAESPTMDATTTGVKTAALSSSVSLQKGKIYCFGVRSSGTMSVSACTGGSVAGLWIGTSPTTTNRGVLSRSTAYASATQSPWVWSISELSSSAQPLVFMRST